MHKISIGFIDHTNEAILMNEITVDTVVVVVVVGATLS